MKAIESLHSAIVIGTTEQELNQDKDILDKDYNVTSVVDIKTKSTTIKYICRPFFGNNLFGQPPSFCFCFGCVPYIIAPNLDNLYGRLDIGHSEKDASIQGSRGRP